MTTPLWPLRYSHKRGLRGNLSLEILIARMWFAAAVLGLCILLYGCAASPSATPPSLTLTKIPPFEEGSSLKLYEIEGRAAGARRREKVVLYARAGVWWIQPTTAEPFTWIARDGAWRNKTHPGAAYAALLVTSGFRAPPKLEKLPEVGGPIRAVATAEGNLSPSTSSQLLHFSGYDWEVRNTPASPGGTLNQYDPANAWTDANGFLHMRIAGKPGNLKSAEIYLNRSLGYGTYLFVVRDVAQLDPSAVFSMMTWDDAGAWSEMDIEISRWGQPGSRNGQFVIQPYYIPANSFRFASPVGRTTFMLQWSPERAQFKTFSGAVLRPDAKAPIEHVFTAAVPSAGDERVHLNLYIFSNPLSQSLRGAEVVVENFEFMP